MSPISFSAIHLEDFHEIKAISDTCFGFNYLTMEQLAGIIEFPGVFLKIRHQELIIGFCITRFIADEKTPDPLILKAFSQNFSFPYGIIKTIAILPEFQNKGFGFALLETIIGGLRQKYNVRVFLYPAWTESESFLFTNKLKKLGFKSVEKIPDFWYADSMKHNYRCIKCGQPPCRCSLTLFKLSF